MIYRFSVVSLSQPSHGGLTLHGSVGPPDLRERREYFVETDKPLSEVAVRGIEQALGDGLIDEARLALPIDPSRMVLVVQRRDIVDNESEALVAVCGLVGVHAVSAKVGTTYESSDPRLAEIVRRSLFNPTIHELHTSDPDWETLTPSGSYERAATYDLATMTDDDLLKLGSSNGRNLNLVQMHQLRELQAQLGGQTTEVLLQAVDARWSDHCYHTTWKECGDLLTRLRTASARTQNPNVVSMFDDNAGVWSFYGGYGLAIKGETHNAPTAVVPYFGQLTKLGGVLRDILGTGLGADPIGVFEYTATGVPGSEAVDGTAPPSVVAHDTMRAIQEYGNTFGAPMAYAHMTFHERFRAKPFAVGGALGLIPLADALPGRPERGDQVVLLGGLTGDEGIHGASASSSGSAMSQAAVQIGAPLEEVKFRQAIVDLREAGCLRAVTDVGGAGLNSAVGEMGDPTGVWLNTAVVPLKTSALPMWRILLSESQERMVLCVPPPKLVETRRIAERHLVRMTVIGRFSGNGRYRVFHDPAVGEDEIVGSDPDGPAEVDELGFDVPYGMLSYVPAQRILARPPVPARPPGWPRLDAAELASLAEKLFADPEVCSQAAAITRYDSTVQGRTLHGPLYGRRRRVRSGYWASAPVDGQPWAVVLTVRYDPWTFESDPVAALRQGFMAAVGAQVLAGVPPGDIALCDNFYTPDRDPDGHAWLVAMVDELAMLVEAFGVPVISGKDSSAGSVVVKGETVSVPPSVLLTAVGKVRDHATLLPEAWSDTSSVLVRIGPSTPSPAGTAAARAHGLTGGGLDDVSIASFRDYVSALVDLPDGLLRSGSTIGAGGTLARIALGVLESGYGAELAPPSSGAEELVFEHRCGAIVEVAESRLSELPDALAPVVVGRLTDVHGTVVLDGVELVTRAAVRAWESSWRKRVQ